MFPGERFHYRVNETSIHVHNHDEDEKETKMVEIKEAKQESVIGEKPQPTEDEIRKRAYEVYCARNGGTGSEVDDWLKAEVELKEGPAAAG